MSHHPVTLTKVHHSQNEAGTSIFVLLLVTCKGPSYPCCTAHEMFMLMMAFPTEGGLPFF